MKELYNFIDRNGVCDQEWITQIDTEKEGLCMVKNMEYKVNFVNNDGKYISSEWFKSAKPFTEGFACVQRNYDKKWNFLKPDGTLLSSEWYDNISSFSEGIGCVKRSDNKWYYINKKGIDICDRGFMIACDFNNGFGSVFDYDNEDDAIYKVDTDGVLYSTHQDINDEWLYGLSSRT